MISWPLLVLHARARPGREGQESNRPSTKRVGMRAAAFMAAPPCALVRDLSCACRVAPWRNAALVRRLFCWAGRFLFELQQVPDYEGRGESTPHAYFYQNLGEAEYVVALFM